MPTAALSLLTLLILAVATLYSAVGQAGASGYLAVMALVGLTSEVMKPTALVLNILVASIAVYKFYRVQPFNWSLLWPFALGSVPLAWVGGSLLPPDSIYRPLVAVALLVAAVGLLRKAPAPAQVAARPVQPLLAVLVGAAIGFVSGLTGVGGGIFLSPLILLLGWAGAKETTGVSAAFIWLNSVAGLAGHTASLATVPSFLPVLVIAAIVGGWIGAGYGSKHLGSQAIQRVLAGVLFVAGIRMMFSRDN